MGQLSRSRSKEQRRKAFLSDTRCCKGTLIDGMRRRFPNLFQKAKRANGTTVLNRQGNAKWEKIT